MVKDYSIFENRFIGKLRSRNASKILGFLKKKNGGYCDDCLSLELGITPRQQVNQICRKLQSQGKLVRKKGTCVLCRRNKLVNFLTESSKTIKITSRSISIDKAAEEERIREAISEYLGIQLYKENLLIFGKEKEFDLVNIEAKIVGDIKIYTYRGGTPSGEYSNICEYVWLMEKLEESSGTRWRKIIVGSGHKETFVKYAKNYHAWLGDTEIYFIDNDGKVKKIRDSVKLYL